MHSCQIVRIIKWYVSIIVQVRHKFGCQDDILNVEGKEVRRCNWVRFCKSSDKLELSNIFASCSEGKITYQTLRAIKPNDEIVVFFNPSSVQSDQNIKQEIVGDSEHSIVANNDDNDEEEEEEEIDVVDFSPEDDKETVTTDKEQNHLDQTKSEFNSSSESGRFSSQFPNFKKLICLKVEILKYFLFVYSKKRKIVLHVSDNILVTLDVTYCQSRRLSFKRQRKWRPNKCKL